MRTKRPLEFRKNSELRHSKRSFRLRKSWGSKTEKYYKTNEKRRKGHHSSVAKSQVDQDKTETATTLALINPHALSFQEGRKNPSRTSLFEEYKLFPSRKAVRTPPGQACLGNNTRVSSVGMNASQPSVPMSGSRKDFAGPRSTECQSNGVFICVCTFACY